MRLCSANHLQKHPLNCLLSITLTFCSYLVEPPNSEDDPKKQYK